jgi:hypothetical protein
MKMKILSNVQVIIVQEQVKIITTLMLLPTNFIAMHQKHLPHLIKLEKIFKALIAPLRATKKKAEAFIEVPEDDDATLSEVIKNLQAVAEAEDQRACRLARRTAVTHFNLQAICITDCNWLPFRKIQLVEKFAKTMPGIHSEDAWEAADFSLKTIGAIGMSSRETD